MEKPLETVWVGPQVGWDEDSGNHHSRVKSISQVYGDSDMDPAHWLC